VLTIVCLFVAVAVLAALVAWVLVTERRAARAAWSRFERDVWDCIEACSREKRRPG
jgi:hypothetical protein